jgi:hypothetical protein
MLNSYQESHNDPQFHLTEAKERYHQEYHTQEHIFEDGCAFCHAEKCTQCRGRGMSENGKLICGKCNGRGRII